MSAEDLARVRREVTALAKNWRQVLIASPQNASPIVSSLLMGRVTFRLLKERRRAWELRGTGTLDGLFTRDLLSAGLASLMPASWNQIAAWLDQIDRLRRAA